VLTKGADHTSRVSAFPSDLVVIQLTGSAVLGRVASWTGLLHSVLLNDEGLPPEKRATITKLLIEQEDKLEPVFS
jgi:hypothetical protein